MPLQPVGLRALLYTVLSNKSALPGPAATEGSSHDAGQNAEVTAATASAPSVQHFQPLHNGHQQQSSVPDQPVASGSNSWSEPFSPSHAYSLETIDDVCNAIYDNAVSGGDIQSRQTLAAKSLLPALNSLEARGTNANVPGRTVLRSQLQSGQDPLQALLAHVPVGGLGVGYLFILVARCYAENADVSYLLPFILQYIQMADVHQMRLAPSKVGSLASIYGRFMAAHPEHAISPLSDLHMKLAGDNRHLLAPTHAPLLYTALQAGEHTTIVQQLLTHRVLDVDCKIMPVTYQDNLAYHFYGGIHLAVARHYEQAIQLLETAVSAPSQPASTSSMQISAYQYLILCQLLLQGKTAPLAKFASSQISSTFRQLYGTPYLDFVKAYETLDAAKIVEIAVQHRKQFEKDQIFGLVTRCVEAVPSRKIIQLAKLYKTVAVEDVVRSIGILRTEAAPTEDITSGCIAFTDLETAKQFVRQTVGALIEQKKLSATITSTEGSASSEYLEFVTRRVSPAEADRALQASLNVLRNTSWTVSNMDNDISISREFLGKASAAAGRGSFGDTGTDNFLATLAAGGEEDLMMGTQDKGEFWED